MRPVLERPHAWLIGEKEAFRAAMDGESLATALGILIRTAVEEAGDERRCAFYIANREGTELSHVVGMPEAYAKCVAGFKIGPDSLACGLAVSSGAPVITRDVFEEPRWEPLLWLAQEYDYRGCWSFPVETSTGKIVGSFAMYFREPRVPNPRDRELVGALTEAASIIISRHQEAGERAQAVAALALSNKRLRAYLSSSFDVVYRMSADWRVMHQLSGKEFIADTVEPSGAWLDKYILPEDQAQVLNAINRAIASKGVFEMEHRVVRADGGVGWTLSRAVPVLDGTGKIVEWIGTASDVTARKSQEDQLRRMVHELNHRVKNTLAVVQSMAMQSLRNDSDTELSRKQFMSRLVALSKAHDILTREHWEGAPLSDVIAETIAAHSKDRFEIVGPEVWLSARQAIGLSMALHELSTNALKHGALSADPGRVKIEWSVTGVNGTRELNLIWTEQGGPPVFAPLRSGFGLRLLEQGLPQDLRGDVKLEFERSGVKCAIHAALDGGNAQEPPG